MGIMYDYVTEKAAKKDMTPKEWLMKNTEFASKCRLVTHVGGFTHPDEKIFLDDKTSAAECGYLTTAGLKTGKKDTVYNSAAYMAIAGLMLLELEDGQAVWKHLEDDTPLIRQELKLLAMDGETFRRQMLQAVTEQEPKETSAKMRQIYFPIAGGEYHLLTPLTSSVLLTELKERIDAIRKKRWSAIKKDSPDYGSDYELLDDVVCVLYGGTKPQNISTRNSQNAGRAFMLSSVPPALHQMKYRPYNDFFRSLRMIAFEPLFRSLQKLFKLDINNIDIRLGIEKRIFSITRQVVDRMIELQSLESGWTDAANCHLPLYQKILLDNKNREIRQNQDIWFGETVEHATKWFFETYGKIVKDEKFMFGDAEYIFVREKIKVALEEDKEYLL